MGARQKVVVGRYTGECCCGERCTLGVESIVVFHKDVILLLENDLKNVKIIITIRQLLLVLRDILLHLKIVDL
jgi:hypothetical protein